jgi:hypothetical protein
MTIPRVSSVLARGVRGGDRSRAVPAVVVDANVGRALVDANIGAAITRVRPLRRRSETT